jgi:hypothetical protein
MGLPLSSSSARLPSIEPFDFDLRKWGSNRLARGLLVPNVPNGRDELDKDEESRVEGGRDIDMKLILTLSSVFSFSSSHSLSEPPSDIALAKTDVEPETSAGVMVTATGAEIDVDAKASNFDPPSSRFPCPASSRHCTFLAFFFSFSLSDAL